VTRYRLLAAVFGPAGGIRGNDAIVSWWRWQVLRALTLLLALSKPGVNVSRRNSVVSGSQAQRLGTNVTSDELIVTELKDFGDERGSSFPAPEACLGGGFALRDAHLSTLQPGRLRGNHFHVARQEILLVMFTDRWSLHWDTGNETPVTVRVFDGTGAVIVRVPPYASHALRNDGSSPLHIVGLTDGPYDPGQPDAFPRQVASLQNA
jgi:dTDP-4-dehydrorhamnose 3,5-epimerase-like enzyme